MMRSGAVAGSIVAPISRSRKRKHTNISIGILSTIVTAIAVIVTVLLAMSVLTSRSLAITADRSDGDGTGHGQKQALRQAAADQSRHKLTENRGILIHTDLGTVRIYFTPQLSGATSVEYIQKVVLSSSAHGHMTNSDLNAPSCDRCNFYRAEPNLLLQGVLSQHDVPSSGVLLGPCPLADWKPTTPCPAHDQGCGCHGPLMTRALSPVNLIRCTQPIFVTTKLNARGMVGWAGGGNGPDFFINTYIQPVEWWEHQHTVWGQIKDEESLQLVERIYNLPATVKGMRMLDEKIEFRIELF
ncbi:hypothetical protein HJC23_004755 [Cyclotella cryptica]|uniref:PPIase cyclophilin-type domain-containing protein n=1 Tax=Cyclotella cryptica TaxID=29204 RepID=A0ABD3PC64_9STRA